MASGIHREDEDGIEYWMAKGGRGRERVSWVMKLGISDVSSKLILWERERRERSPSLGYSDLGIWIPPERG
jgi:hypothetical protein